MKKRILVIGSTGIIGTAIIHHLEPKYEVLCASRNGSFKVDLDHPSSIDALFDAVGEVDAVVCAAAHAKMAPLELLSDEQILHDLQSKLLGQIALFRRAVRYIRDNGSITLTSGSFSKPMPGSSIGALVNAGLEAFVHSAAIELPRGIRANTVSPGWIKETLMKMGRDTSQGTAADIVARSYIDAIEGTMQGQTLTP